MKNHLNKIKEKSDDMLNFTKSLLDSSFDFAKIKSSTIKEKINESIRKKAILATKAILAQEHKSFDDFSDEELDIIILNEERKIIDDLKTKSLFAVLAVLGLDFLI